MYCHVTHVAVPPATMWVPETEFRSSGVAAASFSHWAILSAQNMHVSDWDLLSPTPLFVPLFVQLASYLTCFYAFLHVVSCYSCERWQNQILLYFGESLVSRATLQPLSCVHFLHCFSFPPPASPFTCFSLLGIGKTGEDSSVGLKEQPCLDTDTGDT